MLRTLALLVLIPAAACGSGASFDITISTQMPPYIHRVDPAQAGPGDTVAIYGFGFSFVAANNVVTIAGYSTVAEGYTLLATPQEGEIESITFKVPDGAPAGQSQIFVTAFENTSNTNITIIVQ